MCDEVGIDEVEPGLLAERLAAIAAGAGDECPTGLAVGVFTVGADIAVGGPERGVNPAAISRSP